MAVPHALTLSTIATGALLTSSVALVDSIYAESIGWLNELEQEYLRGTDSPAPAPTKAFGVPAVGTPVRATLGQPVIPLGRRLNIPIEPTSKAQAELVGSALNRGTVVHGSKLAAPLQSENHKSAPSAGRAPLTRSNSRNKVAAVAKPAPVPPEPTVHAAPAAKTATTAKAAARSKPAAGHAAPIATSHAAVHAAPVPAPVAAAPEAKKEEPKLVRQDSRGKRPLLSTVAKERAAKQSKPLTLTCTETEHVVAVRDAHPPPLLQRARSRKSMSRRSTAAAPAASTQATAGPSQPTAAPTAPAPHAEPVAVPAPETKAAHGAKSSRRSVATHDKSGSAHAAPTAAASHPAHVPSYAAPTATSASHAAATHPHTDKTHMVSASLTAPTAASKARAPAPRTAAPTAAPKAPAPSAAKKPAASVAAHTHTQHAPQTGHQTTAPTSSQPVAPAPAPVPMVVLAPPPAPTVLVAPERPIPSVAISTPAVATSAPAPQSQPSVAPSVHAPITVSEARAPAPAPDTAFASVPVVPPSELAPVFRNPAALRRRSSRMMGRPIHRRSLAGMDKEVADRMLARYSLPTERAVLAWISAVLGERIPVLEPLLADPSQHVRPILGDALHDGQLLCRLANKLRPGVVARFNERRVPLYDRENIQLYLNACGRMGLMKQDLFIVSDLYEEKSIPAVLTNLMALGRRFAHVKPALVLPSTESLSLDTLINEPGQSAAALAADEARRVAAEQRERERAPPAPVAVESAGSKRKDSPVAVAAPAQRRRSDEKAVAPAPTATPAAPAPTPAVAANNGRVQIVRSEDGAKLGLAQWVKKRVASVDASLAVSNFTSDWQDGRAFCALMASLCPTHFAMRPEQVAAADTAARLAAAFRTAEALSVPQLVDASDFGLERLSMMTYLSEFQALDGAKKGW